MGGNEDGLEEHSHSENGPKHCSLNKGRVPPQTWRKIDQDKFYIFGSGSMMRGSSFCKY